jgi:hypothetical protein
MAFVVVVGTDTIFTTAMYWTGNGLSGNLPEAKLFYDPSIAHVDFKESAYGKHYKKYLVRTYLSQVHLSRIVEDILSKTEILPLLMSINPELDRLIANKFKELKKPTGE